LPGPQLGFGNADPVEQVLGEFPPTVPVAWAAESVEREALADFPAHRPERVE
jgi:hypothetical protein